MDGRGDAAREKFERVFTECYKRVLGYLLRRVDEQVAEDVMSETFLVAWRRVEEIPADDALPWLLGVARRTLSNQRRSAARQEALREKVAVHAPVSVPEPAAGEASVIAEAMNRLDERDREVLSLHAWEDLSAERIAEVLGCTRATARLRLHRARKRLVRALRQVEGAV